MRGGPASESRGFRGVSLDRSGEFDAQNLHFVSRREVMQELCGYPVSLLLGDGMITRNGQNTVFKTPRMVGEGINGEVLLEPQAREMQCERRLCFLIQSALAENLWQQRISTMHGDILPPFVAADREEKRCRFSRSFLPRSSIVLHRSRGWMPEGIR